MKSESSFQKLKADKTRYTRSIHERNLAKQVLTDNLNLQIITRQMNFLRYFSRMPTTHQHKYSYYEILKKIDHSPTNLITFFSSHIFNRVSIWIQKFISMPKEVASAISQFFENDYNFHFFAYVTFPSLYHHFITNEFCDSAAQLVTNMILNEPRYISNAFVLSYLQSSKFCESLWYNFDSSNHKDDVYARLIHSIKAANVCLTKYQIQIFTHLFEKSKTNFGRVVYGRLFLKSYLEFHEGQENSPLSTFLQTMTVTTRNPQFNEIYEAIVDQIYFLDKANLIKYEKFNRIPIILSPCEIYTIQNLAQFAPEVFDYPLNEPKNLKVQDSYENDLTQLSFDVDLTSQFKANIKSSNNSYLFGKCEDQDSPKLKSYCQWIDFVVEQETNHNLYLSLINREKFSKSQMIKIYSKILLLDSKDNKTTESSPVLNWLARLNKINFSPTLYPDKNSSAINSKPKIESKVFKYSLNNYISNCQNKEAKLWIYLRNYAKCDRHGIFNDDYLNFFDILKNLRHNYQDDITNDSFNNFFTSFLSFFSTLLKDDKTNTIQFTAFLGIVIRNASNHYGISAEQIFLRLLTHTHYHHIIEEIVWSNMMFQHVPEIKKLLFKGWDDGITFAVDLLHKLVTKTISSTINPKDSLIEQDEQSSL